LCYGTTPGRLELSVLDQLDVSTGCAIRTLLTSAMPKVVARRFEMVPPADRTSFGRLAENWATTIDWSCRGILEEQAA
jgi:hypothetical protein